MEFQQPTSPMVKFELPEPTSAEYSQLFSPSTPMDTSTMDPMELMTPQSPSEEDLAFSPSADSEDKTQEDDTLSSEKKPKKRKSWGQVLPEPKTNLPPRKRAKTDDEKEQRRVERVLRNRRAAQSSRERKRQEVEQLEAKNKQLEEDLEKEREANRLLMQQLHALTRNSGNVPTGIARLSPPLDTLTDNPVSLSHQLFRSQDGHKQDAVPSNPIMELFSEQTVNPQALSPELGPVNDDDLEVGESATKQEKTSGSTSDLTQHPAAMLSDLPCQTSEQLPQSFLASQQSLAPLLFLRMTFLSALATLEFLNRPLTQIALSLKVGSSLLPTPQLLTTIIWLVTIPHSSRIKRTSTSTSTTSSPTMQPTARPTLWQRATMPRSTTSTSHSTTLRLKSLQKILTSSPMLARPLLDATMEALRLASSSDGSDTQIENALSDDVMRGDVASAPSCWNSTMELPSKEALMTLMWVLRLEERKQRQNNASLAQESVVPDQPIEYVLKVTRQKRRKMEIGEISRKRTRLI